MSNTLIINGPHKGQVVDVGQGPLFHLIEGYNYDDPTLSTPFRLTHGDAIVYQQKRLVVPGGKSKSFAIVIGVFGDEFSEPELCELAIEAAFLRAGVTN